MMKHTAGETSSSLEEPRVSLRRGLPLIIPGDLRLSIEGADPSVIRVTLSLFSIYRMIVIRPKFKLSSITEPFSGLYQTVSKGELDKVISISPFKKLLELPKESSQGALLRSIKEAECLSVLKPRGSLLLSNSSGPNCKVATLGSALDAIAFKGQPGLTALQRVANYTGLHLYKKLESFIKTTSEDLVAKTTKTNILGKLALKFEPAGKVRVFAIVDIWTQSLLEPLHLFLFKVLKTIKQDGTFNQLKPIELLMERVRVRSDKYMASFDLSSATDRLPVLLQKDLLSSMISPDFAEAWKDLLVDRDWYLPSSPYKGVYRYAVGQPMGALSSWAMLALTHHFIVQMAARRSGFKSWFLDYAILGDDVVIAHEGVAASYLTMMEDLGVTINFNKSLVSRKGVCEFAKRLISVDLDFSPCSPKLLMSLYYNHWNIVNLLYDLRGRGWWSELANLRKLLVTSWSDREESVPNKVWLVSDRMTELVGVFGLQVSEDLTPTLSSLALSSLQEEESKTLSAVLLDVLGNDALKRHYTNLLESEKYYRKVRRSLSLGKKVGRIPVPTPFVEDILIALSERLMLTTELPHLGELSKNDLIRSFGSLQGPTLVGALRPEPQKLRKFDPSKSKRFEKEVLSLLELKDRRLYDKIVTNQALESRG